MPDSMSSALPPTRVATIGRREAMASRMVLETPSARDVLVPDTDAALEVVGDLARERDVALHERPIEPTHIAVSAATAVRIVRVPAVLAMDADRHARGPRRHLRLERRQIARMDDRRL